MTLGTGNDLTIQLKALGEDASRTFYSVERESLRANPYCISPDAVEAGERTSRPMTVPKPDMEVGGRSVAKVWTCRRKHCSRIR